MKFVPFNTYITGYSENFIRIIRLKLTAVSAETCDFITEQLLIPRLLDGTVAVTFILMVVTHLSPLRSRASQFGGEERDLTQGPACLKPFTT